MNIATMPGEAKLKYGDGEYWVILPGQFVRCAITKVQIPISDLKYWSVERQEAYATPAAAQEAYLSSRK